MVSQLQGGIKKHWKIMLNLQLEKHNSNGSMNLIIRYPLRAWKVKRVQMMAKGRMKVRSVAATLQDIKATLQDIQASLQDTQAFSTRDLFDLS